MKSFIFNIQHLFIYLGCALLAYSCGPEPEVKPEMGTVSKTHYNVLLASDLSNRINNGLYPRAISDETIVNSLVDLIHPDILRQSRTIQQKDKYRVLFTNQKIVQQYGTDLGNLQIDFGVFGTGFSNRIEVH